MTTKNNQQLQRVSKFKRICLLVDNLPGELERFANVKLDRGGRQWLATNGPAAAVISTLPDMDAPVPVPEDEGVLCLSPRVISAITGKGDRPGYAEAFGGIKFDLVGCDLDIEETVKAQCIRDAMAFHHHQHREVVRLSIDHSLLAQLIRSIPPGFGNLVQISVNRGEHDRGSLLVYSRGTEDDGFEAAGVLAGVDNVGEHREGEVAESMQRIAGTGVFRTIEEEAADRPETIEELRARRDEARDILAALDKCIEELEGQEQD